MTKILPICKGESYFDEKWLIDMFSNYVCKHCITFQFKSRQKLCYIISGKLQR